MVTPTTFQSRVRKMPVPEARRPMLHLILPREHGGWSLTLEPLAQGLIAAPTVAGAGLAVAVTAGFLLRRPLKRILGGEIDLRRSAAIGGAVILGIVAAAGLMAAALAAGPMRLWPLLLAAPPGMMFVWFDSRGESRAATAEIAGATAFAFVPAALASVAGWEPAGTLGLAAVMAGRSVPAVLTVRAYLRRHKGQPVSRLPAIIASLAALAGFVLLVRAHLAPGVTAWCGARLAARTLVLLGPAAPRLKANTLGLAEAGFGGILVLVLALNWSR